MGRFLEPHSSLNANADAANPIRNCPKSTLSARRKKSLRRRLQRRFRHVGPLTPEGLRGGTRTKRNSPKSARPLPGCPSVAYVPVYKEEQVGTLVGATRSSDS